MGDSKLFPERIETDRLELAAMTTDSVDVLEYYRICAGLESRDIDEVTEYLPWDPHDHPKETLEFLESVEDRRTNDDGTEYLIRPKEGEDYAGEIAGATMLRADWDRRTGILGMWLRKPFWGRGYSGERAAALMEVAFERLDLELVAVSHVEGNDKSRRAIEKYVEAHGGRHEGLLRNWLTIDGQPHDLHRYSVSREEYREATGGSPS
jgi:RimJ/RimL family protein N-acetyltransferase